MENFLDILRALSREDETPDVNEQGGSSSSGYASGTSSGFASALPSLNSSRRSSIQSEVDEASGVVAKLDEPSEAVRSPDPAVGPAGGPAGGPSNWTSMFAAIGTAVAVGAAAYVAYKVTTSGAQATLATTLTECEQQVEEIKRYLNVFSFAEK